MLHINDLVLRIGGRVLFDQATAHIPAGERVGLVGRNGAGKTTLFRLIAGDLSPDGGSVSIRPRARLGQVAQEISDSSDPIGDWVLAADRERTGLLSESARLEAGHGDPQHLADIHDRLNAIDAHAAPARAAAILAGLGFDAQAQERPLVSFSGGWRMRVALAAALFARPDLLLLDEPTNHLDLEAALWLRAYLATYPGTLIVISHDRDLLNDVAGRILHLDGGKLTAYGGNYDNFERVRRERLDLAAKTYASQMEQRRKIQSFIDRFRAKATKAAQAQSRIKMLERMGPAIPVIEDRTQTFEFPDPAPLPPPLIAVENGVVGYGDRPVLRDVALRIDMDDRIALLGANGNGKSTLAKLLAGRLELSAGRITRPPRLKVGYFAQHQTDDLAVERTALDHMRGVMPDSSDTVVRAQLGRFGFSRERADIAVGALSGGEKARLLLALMSRNAPHMMILDEPTNHLDIDAREALMAALNAYEGAVILVSHETRLVETVADRLWLVADGTVRPFDGDLDDYRRLLLEKARDTRRGPAGGPMEGNNGSSRRDARRDAAQIRTRLAPLRRRAEAADKALHSLGERKKAVEAKLADPALYQADPAALTAFTRDLAEIDRALAEAESEWLEAHEAWDEAKSGALQP